MKQLIIVISLIFLLLPLQAQIAINEDKSDPDPSAMLDVQSTKKGFVIPRMSLAQRDSISSPATGLQVYVIEDSCHYFFNGNSWIKFKDNLGNHTATQTLQLNGNYLSGDGDSEGIIVDSMGRVGIGLGNPQAQLHVQGDFRLENGNIQAGNVLRTDENGTGSWQPIKATDILLPTDEMADLSCPKLSISIPLVTIPRDVRLVGDALYITTVSTSVNAFWVFDVSDPTLPVLKDSVQFPSGARPDKFSIAGGVAYILDERLEFIRVVNVANPDSIFIVSTFSFQNSFGSIATSGSYAYVVDPATRNLRVVDISNPAQLNLVQTVGQFGDPREIVIQDTLAYIPDVNVDSLIIFSLGNPTNPSIIGRVRVGPTPNSVDVKGNYAYIVDEGSNDLKVIDVSNPSSPVVASSLGIGNAPSDVFVIGDFALVSDPNVLDDLKIIDIKNPLNPILRGQITLGAAPFELVAGNGFAFVIDETVKDLKSVQLRCPLLFGVNSGGFAIDSTANGWTSDGSSVFTSQNIGIGSSQPQYKLQVGEQGDGSLARANSWTTWSDSSLKRDWKEIENPLALLSQLNGYYYHWKDENADSSRQVGVLAQEVAQVLPELVHIDGEGIHSVDYAKLCALLIESNQALKAELDAVKQAAQSQQKFNLQLEARLQRLEAQARR